MPSIRNDERICCIPGCTLSKRLAESNLLFCRFPTHASRKCQRKAWIAVVRQSKGDESWEPRPCDEICSRHFLPNCITKYPRIAPIVHIDAVPTLHLDNEIQEAFLWEEEAEEAEEEPVSGRKHRNAGPSSSSSPVSVRKQALIVFGHADTRDTKVFINDEPSWETIEEVHPFNVGNMPGSNAPGSQDDVEKSTKLDDEVHDDPLRVTSNDLHNRANTSQTVRLLEETQVSDNGLSHHSCEKSFHLEKSKVHTSTPVEKPIFPCPHCSLTFTRRCPLSSHVKTHSNSKSQKLPKPNKATEQKERRFHTCITCSKTFSTLSGLKSHSASHQERRFSCPHCPQSYITTGGVKRHVHNKHSIRPSLFTFKD